MSKTTNKFSPEVRERAVGLVLDNEGQHGSRWQAVMSISAKIGCAPQTLNDWVKKAEVDSGKRPGVSSEMAERMKALERENRELRQANEILRKIRLPRSPCLWECDSPSSAVVSQKLWKFPGGALRACEGSVSQAARSRGIGSRG